jgi:pimeloyl-ACP methyl ester carboxylesterase
MTQVQTTTDEQAKEPRSQPPNGERARERLLAGMPVTERRLQLAGVPTVVLEGGDGPPVVLLHGPGEHAPKWIRVIPNLTTTHRVIAPDLPGHGNSPVTDGPLDADRVIASRAFEVRPRYEANPRSDWPATSVE